MQLSFECPSCGKSYDLPWALAGKRVRCSQCSNDFVVPVPFEPKPPRSSEAIPVVKPEEPPPRRPTVARTMKIEVPPPPPLPEPEPDQRAIRANRKGGALTPELLERLRTGRVVRPGEPDPPPPTRRPKEEPSRARAPQPSRPAPAYDQPQPVLLSSYSSSSPRPPWLIPAIVGGGIALVLAVNIAFYLAFFGGRAIADRAEPAEAKPAEASGPEGPAEVPEDGSPAPAAVEESAEKVKVAEAEVVPDPPMNTADIVARFEPSVALIKGKKGSGTGFIARAGIVATNSHVIVNERIKDIEVRFPSAEKSRQGPYPAKVIYQDRERDLALLEVATDLPPVRLAEAYKFRKGEDVTVIGNPGVGDRMILENAISRGIVSSMTTLKSATTLKRHAFLQLGIAINPGNSGGPVFDHKGRVIGVVTLKTTLQEGLAFAIPADDLRAALDLVDPSTAADSPRGKALDDRR